MSLIGKSLNAATSTGPGKPLLFDEPKSFFTIQTSSSGGTSYQVAFEATVDGVNWRPFSETINSDTILSYGGNLVVMGVRANLVSVSGGNVSASIAVQRDSVVATPRA